MQFKNTFNNPIIIKFTSLEPQKPNLQFGIKIFINFTS